MADGPRSGGPTRARPDAARRPAEALAEWRAVLGDGRVETDPATLAAWGRRTFAPDVAVLARLRPATAEAVAACLGVASRHGVPLHPVSRGANWGLGSRAPTCPDAAILDLRDLDRISRFDARDGLVHVEPGVTFAALSGFLRRRGADYFLPRIGGPVSASVLANALDRGDGLMGGRWDSLGDLDVVLPDGRRLGTGYAGRGAGRLAGLAPGPAGPLVDGLFSQSRFGVVVGGWIRLEPLPPELAAFTLEIGALERLPRIVEAWRALQRDSLLPDRAVTLWNGVKLLARDHARGALPPALRDAAGLGAWFLSGLLRAESGEVLAQRSRRVEATLRPLARGLSLQAVRRGGVWRPGREDFLGLPDEQNLRSAYWAKAQAPAAGAMDPDRDRCGLIWLCLAHPFEGRSLADFAVWAEGVLGGFGFELNLGVEAGSFRTLQSYLAIAYDRDEPGADGRALEAYARLLDGALERGLAPYRLANGLPQPPGGLLPDPLADYLAALQRVGDPAGILSPGRGPGGAVGRSYPLDAGPSSGDR